MDIPVHEPRMQTQQRKRTEPPIVNPACQPNMLGFVSLNPDRKQPRNDKVCFIAPLEI